MQRTVTLARGSWRLISEASFRGLAVSANHTRPLLGKGSSWMQTRLSTSSSASNQPFLNTDWASPSEDDIHVSDGVHVSDGAEDGLVQFSSFPLSQKVLSSLRGMGCETTFEIQGKTIPLMLEGRDVIGRAVTGSGKTLAFALPIIHTLSKSPRTRNPRALVITPTRELCNQVYSCIQSLDHDVRCVALYGGASYVSQENALRRGVDVIIATPGRLNDHRERGNFGLEDMKFLVLDEADELLTPNFKMQIEGILEDCPKDKQVMLFSATLPPDIRAVTRRYMRDAEMVDLVSNRSLIPDSIVHEVCRVRDYQMMSVVPDLLQINQPKRALVFMAMKVQTHRLGSKLNQFGFKAGVLNSDMSQRARDDVIQNFRSGVVEVLVATDVAARGLDIPDIELVLHVGVPPNGVEFYIHRSGRTGRKGQAGKTILICSDRDSQVQSFLNDLRRNKIKLNTITPPSGTMMTDLVLKNAAEKLNPESVEAGVMEKARPYAQELTDKFGADALAAALVSMSKVEWHMGSSNHYKDQSRDSPRGSHGGRGRYGSMGGGGGYRGGSDGYRTGGGGYGRQDRYSRGGGGRGNRRSETSSFEDNFQENFAEVDDEYQGMGQEKGRGHGRRTKQQNPFSWDE